MIAIINNGQVYDLNRTYFVDVPIEHREAIRSAFAGNKIVTTVHDEQLPYLICFADTVEWFKNEATTLAQFVEDMRNSCHAGECYGRFDDGKCTCWVSQLPGFAAQR